MLGKTHIGLALGLSAIGTTLFSARTQTPFDAISLGVFYGGVTLGALFPDIDEPNSTLGKKTFGISNAIKALFGHRGFTHSLCFLIMLGITLAFFSAFGGSMIEKVMQEIPLLGNSVRQHGAQHFEIFAFGLFLGCLFHLFGDMLTPSGVPLLLPFKVRNFHLTPSFLRFKTGSVFDYLVGSCGFFIFAFLNAKILINVS